MSEWQVDTLLDRQREAWLAGARPTALELVQGGEFADEPDVLLDLIYTEVVVREELGELPTMEEYLGRYPGLAAPLRLHFEIHQALRQTSLGETPAAATPRPVNTLSEDGSTPGHLSKKADTSAWPVLGDYEILGELGRGGMGIVYKARQRDLKRLVALKMFQPGRAPSERELARFRTEAEAIARLQHPNIVQIFDLGQAGGLPFLALELAEQETLQRRLQNAAMTPPDAAGLIETLALALHHAHQHHIVHRDLKPANVLFAADGTPKITDFGLAKVLGDDADAVRDATRTGEPIGTPRYMAPEQVAGEHDDIGPATDVYALGTLLYECLTGRPPFVAVGVMETLEKIRRDDPLPVRRLQRAVPRDLETICLTCLQKPARRRYASALALVEDLRRFLDGKPIKARRTPRWERAVKWCRRRPAQAALIGVVALATVAGLVGAVAARRAEEQRLQEMRQEVDGFVRAGQEALERRDWSAAAVGFETAYRKIEAEPALGHLETSVQGLLTQSRRDADQERRLQNRRKLAELHDEVLFGTVLAALNPSKRQPTEAAHATARDALTLIDPGDPSSRHQWNELALLDAELLLAEGDAAAALARLDSLGSEGPSRLQHAQRAQCLQKLERAEEAEDERRKASSVPAVTALDYFLEGRQHFERQEFTRAFRAWEAVLELQPNHFAARAFQAVCFLNLDRPAEARVALTAAIGQRPAFVWCYLFRGQAALKLGDEAAAEADFRRALDMQPDKQATYALHSNLGLLRLGQRRWAEALAELERAARLFPEEAASWLNLAQAHWRAQACALLPPMDSVWPALAAAQWHFRQRRNTEECFDKALAQERSRALVYRERANWFRSQGHWAQALADWDEALRLESHASPARGAAEVERARCLFHLGRLDEATASLRDQLPNPDAWRVLAEVAFKQARFDEAIDKFTQVMAAGAPTADDYQGRGHAHMQLGQFAAAVDDYSRALALRDDADALQQRGWAYFFSDAFRLAKRDFDESLKRRPGGADALIGRGLSRVYLGDCGPALEDAKKAGELATPEMEVNRACIFAQALVRQRGEQRQTQQALGDQAIQSLRRALDLIPVAQRPRFWQQKIAMDPGLVPVRGLAAYEELGRSVVGPSGRSGR
jgi:tetratricopeptide (TPR) repeat protein